MDKCCAIGRLKCLFNRHAHVFMPMCPSCTCHACKCGHQYVMTCKVPYMHVSGAYHLHDGLCVDMRQWLAPNLSSKMKWMVQYHEIVHVILREWHHITILIIYAITVTFVLLTCTHVIFKYDCPGLLIPYEKSPEFWRSALVLPAKDRLKVTSEACESLKIARNVEKSILHYFDNFEAALSVIICVTRQFETFRFIRL